MVKIFPFLFLFTSFFGCEDMPANVGGHVHDQIQTNQNASNSNNTMSIEKLMSLSKSEAVKEFGEPSSQETFTLDDAQGEFRNGISDAYTAEERQRESILIEEATWEKDDATWITVWYEITSDDKTIPKSSLEWAKGSEF